MNELMTLGYVLSAQARINPDKTGARDLERTLSFRMWNERACRLANALAGIGLIAGDRLAVAFFGVRGVGSLYYLAYAAGEAEFDALPWLWSTVGFTIVLSVLVHGISAKPWLARVDRRRGAEGPGLAGRRTPGQDERA